MSISEKRKKSHLMFPQKINRSAMVIKYFSHIDSINQLVIDNQLRKRTNRKKKITYVLYTVVQFKNNIWKFIKHKAVKKNSRFVYFIY